MQAIAIHMTTITFLWLSVEISKEKPISLCPTHFEGGFYKIRAQCGNHKIIKIISISHLTKKLIYSKLKNSVQWSSSLVRTWNGTDENIENLVSERTSALPPRLRSLHLLSGEKWYVETLFICPSSCLPYPQLNASIAHSWTTVIQPELLYPNDPEVSVDFRLPCFASSRQMMSPSMVK